MTFIKLKIFAVTLLWILIPALSNAATNYVDWVSPGVFPYTNTANNTVRYGTGASGTVTNPNNGRPVNVTLTGEVERDYSVFNGGTNWNTNEHPITTYDVSGFEFDPAGEDRIVQSGFTLQQYRAHTITFSEPVEGVVMAIWSLGAPADLSELLFSEDFEILDTTDGLTRSITEEGYKLSGTTNAFNGTGGAGGLIRFYGSHTSISYTVTDPENSSGMSVALSDQLSVGAGGPTITIDNTAPTIIIAADQVNDGDTTNDASLSLTFSTSEATTDFAAGDITVTNGVLRNFLSVSSTSYKATFTPTAFGATTIDVAAASFRDATGNFSEAASQFNWTYAADTTPPTMAITAAEVSDGDTSADDSLSLTFTSSEATADFDQTDITVTNGSISDFTAVSTTVYTATFTPAAGGAMTIDVAAGTFTDASGNNNIAATQFNWTYDNTGPTIAITAAEVDDGDTSADDSLSLTFTSSKATADFDQTDISVTNGSISDFTAVSTTVYTATFTPAAGGATTIDVAAGTFTDASGNNNIAATQFNWTYLSDPTKNPDVVASIMSEELIAYQFYKGSIQSVNGRLAWLAARRESKKTSKQGINFKFSDPILNQFLDSSPKKLSEYNQTDLLTLSSNIASNPEQSKNIITAQAITTGVAALKANTGDIELNPDFENTLNSWSFWSDGEISLGKNSASTLTSSREFNRTLLTFGIDREYKQDSLIGLALSVGREDVDVGTNGGIIQSDNIGAILYSASSSEELPQIEASIGYSDLTFRTKRIEGNDEITGERKGTVYHGSLGFRSSNTSQHQDLSYSSHASLNLGQITLKSYSETGGVTALKYFDQHINYQELEAGLDISKTLRFGGLNLRPHTTLQYSHFLNKSSVASMRYVSLPRQYHLNVPTEMKSGWRIGIGFDLWDHGNFSSSLMLSRSQANAANYVNSIKFGLRYSF